MLIDIPAAPSPETSIINNGPSRLLISNPASWPLSKHTCSVFFPSPTSSVTHFPFVEGAGVQSCDHASLRPATSALVLPRTSQWRPSPALHNRHPCRRPMPASPRRHHILEERHCFSSDVLMLSRKVAASMGDVHVHRRGRQAWDPRYLDHDVGIVTAQECHTG